MIAWLTGKLAGPIFLASTLLLLIALGVTSCEVSNLKSDKADLSKQINDPETGFVRRLAQCETNVGTLTNGFDRMAAQIKDLGAETVAANKRSEAAAKQSATESRAARVRADQVLNLPKPPAEQACAAGAALLKGRVP